MSNNNEPVEKKKKTGKHQMNEKRTVFPRKPGYMIAILLMALLTGAFLVMLILTDVLPPDVTVILACASVALLLFTCLMFSAGRRWKRIAGIFICIIAIAVMGFVTNFMGNTYAMFNTISESGFNATGPAAKRVDPTEEPFSIYITGIDQWECDEGLDLERSDVNMIMTVNPKTKKILLTSIPRDSYVKLHTAQQMDKLTHTGVYGVDETLNTVQDWLGIDLNYYVKLNFSAARDIIDAMDGIKVYSPVTFQSSLKGYWYEKGWNKIGGTKALYFARERHAFEGQDSIRVENQQRVIEAIITKMTSSTTLLTKYGDIMAAAGKNLSTNMPAEDMTALVKMQLTDLAEWDVQTQKIEGEYDMDYVASLTQSQKFSVYKTDNASSAKCVNAINDITNPPVSELEAADKNKSKSFIVNMTNKAIETIKEKIGR